MNNTISLTDAGYILDKVQSKGGWTGRFSPSEFPLPPSIDYEYQYQQGEGYFVGLRPTEHFYGLEQIQGVGGGDEVDLTLFPQESKIVVKFPKRDWECEQPRSWQYTAGVLEFVQEQISERLEAQFSSERLHIGLWMDKGLLYVDVSVHVKSRGVARHLALKHEQLEVFELATCTSIKTNKL